MQGKSGISLWGRRVYFLLALAFVCFIGAKAVDGDPPAFDGDHNFLMAYNLINAGVMSIDDSGQRLGLPATNYREPLYPLLLAGIMKAILPNPLPDLSCFRTKETDCGTLHERLKLLNVGLIIVLLAAFYVMFPLVAEALGLSKRQGGGLSFAMITFIAAGSSYLAKVEFYYSDVLAGLLVFLHGASLLLFITRGRKTWAVVCGLSLGAIVLTKAIFLYWMLMLCLAIVGAAFLSWGRQPGRRAAVAMLIVIAVLPVGSWMTRNHVEIGSFSVSSGRDYQVLGVRAEYDAMRREEYFPGFVYFVPVYGWAAAEKWFDEKDYRRYVRNNPDSFFKVGQSREGLVGRQVEEGRSTYIAALSVFVEHLPMHIATTALMTYRSFFIPAGYRTLRVKVGALSNWMTMATFIIHVTLVPSFILLCIWAVYRRDWFLLIFLAPAIFSVAIHAGLTHYIPRYNLPLIPLLFFSQFVLFCRLWDLISGRFLQERGNVNAS